MSKRFDQRNARNYAADGAEAAVEYFRGLGQRHDARKQGSLREAIDSLADDVELQVSIADFWLNIPEAVGQRRRKHSPPSNPFNIKRAVPGKRGRSTFGRKSDIAEWDIAWLNKDAAAVYAASGSRMSRRCGDMVRAGVPWVILNGEVVTSAYDMTATTRTLVLDQPSAMSIEVMTVEKAVLQRRWVLLSEHRLWLERSEESYRAVLAEHELKHLELLVGLRGE